SVAPGDSVRARAPTSTPLRARTNLQVRDPAKTQTALRRQNHSRRSFPRGLNGKLLDGFLLYSDPIVLLKPASGGTREWARTREQIVRRPAMKKRIAATFLVTSP